MPALEKKNVINNPLKKIWNGGFLMALMEKLFGERTHPSQLLQKDF